MATTLINTSLTADAIMEAIAPPTVVLAVPMVAWSVWGEEEALLCQLAHLLSPSSISNVSSFRLDVKITMSLYITEEVWPRCMIKGCGQGA